MPFTLPQLPYNYDALEPHLDAQTMEIHYTKHHQAYVDKLNAALEGTDWADQSIEEVITNLDHIPADKQKAVRNNGGGHYNHSFFWPLLQVNNGATPTGQLAEAIDKHFDSFDAFKTEFAAAATAQFGSGWAWLVADQQGQLSIVATPNQDNPRMDNPSLKLILGLDVWEHAYYLKYQNKRPDYIAAFWNIINWDVAEANYTA